MTLSPRWRKAVRDLWSNKTRTLLVLFSIAVGVAASGMVLGSQAIINQDLPAAYAAVNPAQPFLDALSLILGAMGILSLLLGSFLIVNTLAAILAQQVWQIGIMKAIGSRSRQLYLVMVVLFGLLSLLLALLASYLPARRASNLTVREVLSYE